MTLIGKPLDSKEVSDFTLHLYGNVSFDDNSSDIFDFELLPNGLINNHAGNTDGLRAAFAANSFPGVDRDFISNDDGVNDALNELGIVRAGDNLGTVASINGNFDGVDTFYITSRDLAVGFSVNDLSILNKDSLEVLDNLWVVGSITGRASVIKQDEVGRVIVAGTTILEAQGVKTQIARFENNVIDETFVVEVDNSINDLLVIDDNIYFVGEFSEVNGMTRNGLAAVDSDGNLLPWNPNAGSGAIVKSVDNIGSNIYFGGFFSTVGGVGRNNAAAVNTDNNLLSWNPNVNSLVADLVADGSTVYLIGSFTQVGGVGRNRAAAVNSTTGALLSWNPNLNSSCIDMAKFGSSIYMTGFLLLLMVEQPVIGLLPLMKMVIYYHGTLTLIIIQMILL